MANELKEIEVEVDSKDLAQIEESVLLYSDAVERAVIKDGEDYIKAGGFLKNIKALAAQIKRTFQPVIQAAHASHKVALKAENQHLAPLFEAEKILKKKMSHYATEKELEQKAEEDRQRKEAHKKAEDERREEAERLRLIGKRKESKAVQEAPLVIEEQIQVAPPPATPVIAGIHHRTLWKWRIIDPAKLPRKFLVPDPAAITDAVRADHDQEIPGVRIYSEKITSG